MKFDTEFNCGDKAWVYLDRATEVTVGEIQIQFRGKSDGMDGAIHGMPASSFSNYGPQTKLYREVYMCKETGIGSGTLWELGANIFRTEEECIAANAKRIEEQRKAQEAKLQWEREDAARRLAQARRDVARLAAKLGEQP